MMRYNPTAVYTPGKDLVVADALSRNPLANRYINALEEVTAHIAAVEATRPATASNLTPIRAGAQTDLQLNRAFQYTMSGWPKYV